jgi:hypothetical protein
VGFQVVGVFIIKKFNTKFLIASLKNACSFIQILSGTLFNELVAAFRNLPDTVKLQFSAQ